MPIGLAVVKLLFLVSGAGEVDYELFTGAEDLLARGTDVEVVHLGALHLFLLLRAHFREDDVFRVKLRDKSIFDSPTTTTPLLDDFCDLFQFI